MKRCNRFKLSDRGPYNRPIQKSDLTIDDCISRYNRKIVSESEDLSDRTFDYLFSPSPASPSMSLFKELPSPLLAGIASQYPLLLTEVSLKFRGMGG